MAAKEEMQELRAELSRLSEKVATLESQLQVEREIGAIVRKKTMNCRGCQRPPEAAEGHPPITELEKKFCDQGHRFVMLSVDQTRMMRGW
jgi:hypothetical protein